MRITEEKFEEVYKGSYPYVLKFVIIKSFDIDIVNDIVQDTYVEFLKKVKKSKSIEIDNIGSYICGIAENIIKRRCCGKKLNIVSENFEDNIVLEDGTVIEDDFITKDNVAKIWDYLKKKDIITLKIFYLYFVLDMKISSISKELNISESNVKHRLYRTIEEIKKRKDVIGYE